MPSREDSLLEALSQATKPQRNDAVWRIERVGWIISLTVGVIALVGLLATWLSGALFWAIACIVVIILAFVFTEWFQSHVPHVHLSEFEDALAP